MLFGLVLCGGQSSRMGSDKGTLLHNGKLWAKAVEEKLEPFCNKTFLSINNSQSDIYINHFDAKKLIKDIENQKGPLAGIISAHKKYPVADWIIIPCDMFDLENFYVENLFKISQIHNYDTFSYKINSFIEPFPSLFKSKYLCTLDQELSENQGVHQVIKKSNAYYIEINQPTFAFKNYNSKNDLMQ
ncbi:MAG: molybdenum cofactor guanylyltransferase [Bacteroidetes bacterium]|nr:MAG: molybdenum cofactor guanylyltransferase [Bacteroidota bacterium]